MRWFHTRKAKGSEIEISYMVTIKEIKPDWIVVAFDDRHLGESNVDPADLEKP